MSENKTETVQQHVERTMHALLSTIDSSITNRAPVEHIKTLAEAFASLSCWPRDYLNPEQHRQLAEYEVEKAFERRGPKS